MKKKILVVCEGYEGKKELITQLQKLLKADFELSFVSPESNQLQHSIEKSPDWILVELSNLELSSKDLAGLIRERYSKKLVRKSSETEIRVGNLRMDPKSFRVWIASKSIRLTRAEFELLRYFINHPNEVIDRQRLLEDLWQDSVVTLRTVDTHVANLRRKIKGFNVPFETIYGSGYILKLDQT